MAEAYNIVFATDVGLVSSQKGSDVPDEFDHYDLIEAQIGGRKIDIATVVESER